MSWFEGTIKALMNSHVQKFTCRHEAIVPYYQYRTISKCTISNNMTSYCYMNGYCYMNRYCYMNGYYYWNGYCYMNGCY